MSVLTHLVSFGLRQVIGDHACTAIQVIEAVEGHFRDHSRALPNALDRAHDRAWQSLGVALAGDGFIDRVKVFFASGDDKGIREQVQFFLKDNAFSFDGTPENFRQSCLEELKRLRKSGLLTVSAVASAEFGRQAAGFRRQADPQGLVEEAKGVVAGVADALAGDYPSLARLIRRPTPAGPPLLAVAFCYFFRREVETDEELAHGLFFDGLRQLTASQARAFGEVNRVLTTLGVQFDALFQQLGRIEAVVVETHGAVLDLSAELARLGGMHLDNAHEIRSLLERVLLRLGQLGMQRGEVGPQHSCTIRDEDERQAVRALLARFRSLPAQEQRQVPALLNGLGKLQLGTGDFAEAGRTFAEVATVVPGAAGKAEASHNAYRVALEEKKFDAALEALRRASSLDAGRFAPFPLHRYEPRRILGAGGFGTAVLCLDRHFDEEVVIKTLHAADLERGLDEVFREARTLRRLSHPAIIGVRDCEYADHVVKSRPYLVMDYFDGITLEQFVEQRGTLTAEQLLPVATQIVRGMQAAHGQGVLHRDLKPANALIGLEADKWKVKIIDFGLALRRSVVETSVARASHQVTILGHSVAGTLKYAPPEQMGEVRGIRPGPYSDVYAFGKTCCYALFKTTEPKSRHWAGLPRELVELVERCTEQELAHRYADFRSVLTVLEALDAARPQKEPQGQDDQDRRQVEEQRLRQEEASHRQQELVRHRDELEQRHQELAQLREDGEVKLALLVRQVLDRTHGKPTKEDTAAANDMVRQHRIEKERAQTIIREERERWQQAQPKESRPGDLASIDLGGGVAMKFAWCPPGTFLMGSPTSELERSDDEKQHRVTLTKGFYLGIHQVTQGQWQAVMGNNPSKFKGDNLPVETVWWEDCQQFVEELGRKTGKRFRLPTEAEWEYACRAGTTTPFYFGETISTDQANYDGNYTYGKGKKGPYRKKTTPVGSYPANAWGLYDMHGNVWDWCQDWYGEYPSEDIADIQSSNNSTARVMRGGSWYDIPRLCRSACRHRGGPGCRDAFCGCRVLLCLD